MSDFSVTKMAPNLIRFTCNDARGHYKQANDEGLVIYHACRVDDVVGFVSIREGREEFTDTGERYYYFEIAYIHVEEPYRGQGLGRMLIDQAIKYVVDSAKCLPNDEGYRNIIRGPCSPRSKRGEDICSRYKRLIVSSEISSLVDSDSFC